MAAFCRSFSAIKPHLGFQVAGAWRFTTRVGFSVVALNALGGIPEPGNFLVLRGLVSASHSQYGGHQVSGRLSIGLMLAGHLAWMALVGTAAWLRGPDRRSLR